jgi:hypothetical protein
MGSVFKNKNILIISPEPWDAIFVSKHHYALALAAANQVFFLNPPKLNAFKSFNISATSNANLWEVDYSPLVRGMQYFPRFIRQSVERDFINRLERYLDRRFDIIWNFENSRFFDFGFARKGIMKIYHQVDLNQNFHPHKAALTADVCFCTSDVILSVIKAANPCSFKVHHGFSELVPAGYEEAIVSSSPNPKVTAKLVGNLDYRYLDLDLLKTIISQNPDVQFELVGPVDKAKSTYSILAPFPNVSFVGKVPAERVPSILQSADILLVTYRKDAWEQMSSPHKFMEYFGSGKVIVATYTDEYKDKQHLLAMAESWEEYPSLFKKVKENLSTYNNIEEIGKRRAFAVDHTYSRQLNKISDIIETHLGKQ